MYYIRFLTITTLKLGLTEQMISGSPELEMFQMLPGNPPLRPPVTPCRFDLTFTSLKKKKVNHSTYARLSPNFCEDKEKRSNGAFPRSFSG